MFIYPCFKIFPYLTDFWVLVCCCYFSLTVSTFSYSFLTLSFNIHCYSLNIFIILLSRLIVIFSFYFPLILYRFFSHWVTCMNQKKDNCIQIWQNTQQKKTKMYRIFQNADTIQYKTILKQWQKNERLLPLKVFAHQKSCKQ